jgi:4-hydroxy-tetrahydrodipicolinate reductase
MTKSLSLSVAGVAGRMGRQLVSAGLAKGHKIIGGTEHSASPDLATDIGTLAGLAPIGRTPKQHPIEATRGAEVWIDFTAPNITLKALDGLDGSSVKSVIIGTTGFTAAQDAAIGAHADRFAIVKAGNFSLGIALLTRLTTLAAQTLGPDWDLEILETHHKHKVDAPSGTALMLGEAAATGRGNLLTDLRTDPYNGPEAKREAGTIGFSVRRAGGVIGEHDVTLSSDTEQITLAHKALDRRVFADGAIKAAEWASTQSPGLYTIHDVLGL